MENAFTLIDRLESVHSLSLEEYEALILAQSDETAAYAAEKADRVRKEIFGNKIYVRGLIEISNICRNNCLYCGIRCSNGNCDRYRLTFDEILECCRQGHGYGFRTFVLQSGEGALDCDEICGLVKEIKSRFSDCAVTLSLGEFSYEEYRRMKEAGADRYLLRHETADEAHYASLHPDMKFENRMRCLKDLKSLGYQTGCGFMVGSPGQTAAALAKDLKFIETFSPEMCGIGPFIPQKDTPLGNEKSGSCGQTLYLLSLLRLIKPNLLLPSTTALGTIDPLGREKGVQAGANVVMPNLSPVRVRKKYALYDGKICTGDESAQCVGCLERRMNSIGFEISSERGDYKEIKKE